MWETKIQIKPKPRYGAQKAGGETPVVIRDVGGRRAVLAAAVDQVAVVIGPLLAASSMRSARIAPEKGTDVRGKTFDR